VSDGGKSAALSPGRAAWRRLRQNRMAFFCLVGFGLLSLWCFAGPIIASAAFGVDGTQQNVRLGPTPPSWAHPFGTDVLGRDLMVRVMDGGQIAIVVALLSTLVALVIGVTWGAVAGFFGGKTDELMMRFVDVMYALPSTVFVIVIMAVAGSRNLLMLFALIGAINWLTMSRIVRGQVLSLRRREFVEAARGLGASTPRIVARHLVPNAIGPIIVYATLQVPAVMLQEAFLSFLGLGVQAPRASWGTLVAEGAEQVVVYPWILIGPGLVMSLSIFALNFLGDGLRDALDPQARR
jgi:oligopeptide transport system permease protein